MTDASWNERVEHLEETVAGLQRKLDLLNSLVVRHLGQPTPSKGESILDDKETDEIRRPTEARPAG